MKKKKWMALGMMLMLVFFAACDKQEESAAAGTGAAGAEEQAVASLTMGAQPAEMDVEYTYAGKKEMTVYYSNGKADGLEKEIIEVDEITPEEVISSLSRHNIVSIDTKVLDFRITETDGQRRKVLELDLSKAFREYIKTMGESGEKAVMGALVNTFLENYQADGLLLTVEGAELETSHGTYRDTLVYWQPETDDNDMD